MSTSVETSPFVTGNVSRITNAVIFKDAVCKLAPVDIQEISRRRCAILEMMSHI